MFSESNIFETAFCPGGSLWDDAVVEEIFFYGEGLQEDRVLVFSNMKVKLAWPIYVMVPWIWNSFFILTVTV